jgi:hypothetical protein
MGQGKTVEEAVQKMLMGKSIAGSKHKYMAKLLGQKEKGIATNRPRR